MFSKVMFLVFIFSMVPVSQAGILSYNSGDLKVELLYNNTTSGINTLLSSELDSMLVTNTLTNEALVLFSASDIIENTLVFEIGLLFNQVNNVTGLLQVYRNDGYCTFCGLKIIPIFSSTFAGSSIDYWDASVGLELGGQPYFENMRAIYFASDFSWDPTANFNGITGADPRLQVSSVPTQGIVGVPEPSTLAIFALGIMGLASRRFKKQS